MDGPAGPGGGPLGGNETMPEPARLDAGPARCDDLLAAINTITAAWQAARRDMASAAPGDPAAAVMQDRCAMIMGELMTQLAAIMGPLEALGDRLRPDAAADAVTRLLDGEVPQPRHGGLHVVRD
jgi:hypothetical protein